MPPEFGIVHERKTDDGFTVLSIDTQKAKYHGMAWQSMGDFGKRKFENLLVISRPRERLKLVYGNY